MYILPHLELVTNVRIIVDNVAHPVEELDDLLGHVVAGSSLQQGKRSLLTECFEKFRISGTTRDNFDPSV